MGARFSVIIAAALLATAAWAAPAKPPRSYSFVATPSGGIFAKTQGHRDGARAVIDETFVPNPKMTILTRFWYDFQSHQVWTKFLSKPAEKCTVQKYVSAVAPHPIDPVSLGASVLPQILLAKPKVGEERLGKFDTKTYEATVQGMKTKVWIEQSHGVLVKMAVAPGGTWMTVTEVEELSFTRPDPGLLTPPTGCTVVPGQTDADGKASVENKTAPVETRAHAETQL